MPIKVKEMCRSFYIEAEFIVAIEACKELLQM